MDFILLVKFEYFLVQEAHRPARPMILKVRFCSGICELRSAVLSGGQSTSGDPFVDSHVHGLRVTFGGVR